VVEVINASIPQPLSSLRLDGGPTADTFLMQFQADILGMELEISGTEELSGAGAAFCAGIGYGVASAEELFSQNRFSKVRPSMDEGERERLYQGWKRAVTGVASFSI
jgi:glycerol kinase